MTLFSIVTPCYNAEKYIIETAMSVLNQSAVLNGRCELEYIICDGASTDATLTLIDEIKRNTKKHNISIKIYSNHDTGMYDALSKGLHSVNGNICAYINAGDYYSQYAFDVLLDIKENYDWKWITGLSIQYNCNSQICSVLLPYIYRSRLIQRGLYGKVLPFIQQESTFWDAELNNYIDYNSLSSFQLAGDYYLWYTFSCYAELMIVESYLGGFKKIKGQLSENMCSYFEELDKIAISPNFIDYIIAICDKFCWKLPNGIKRRLNVHSLFHYNHNIERWEL